MSKRYLSGWLAGLIGLINMTDGLAETGEISPPRAKIAVIIDDLGYHKSAGEAALRLPGPVTYAFLPHTPHAWDQATWAYENSKEVMLHLPMESHNGNLLGDGGLTLDMPKEEFINSLENALDSVPYVAGINNHMGSLLTRDPTAMRWLMSTIRDDDLFFIDSRTTEKTVAEKVARKNLIDSARRNVFLDNEEDEEKIRTQLYKLIDIAKNTGKAIGIGHPYPQTVAVLAEELPKLESLGVELVPASELTNEGEKLWHAYSSPLPRDVKNLKPSPSPIF
ncbi:MAG: divergent polysaccharide deacetylase family protein [Gammaproteobacteria bacterium]|nr:divergent polysaccharide deacetylase family protein [Gammaproteobacteria bacterium]